MKALYSISLCLLLLTANSTVVSGQENEDSAQTQAAQGIIDAYLSYRYQPEEQERLSLFSQSLETMARNLDPLERLSNELEVDGFEEVAQAAEAFLKTAKPFVDRLDKAVRNQPATRSRTEAINESAIEAMRRAVYEEALSPPEKESKANPDLPDSGTEKKSIMSPRMTGDRTVDERALKAVQELLQKKQQEAIMQTALEYYAAQAFAAESEAKEEIGAFQKVVGNEATAKITAIEDRLARLEAMLEKVLSKLDEKRE